MVVVKSYGTLEEAYLAKNLLETEGIESDVLDEATASTAPYLLAYSGIRLSVADEDAERACEVLDLPRAEPSRPPKRGGLVVWFAAILGIAGLSIFFTGIKQTQSSAKPASYIEHDRNNDGKPDERTEFDGSGQPTRSFTDDNFDGTWDTRYVFKNGTVVSSETDLNFDGAFDARTDYMNGLARKETVTPGGKGNPLFRYDHAPDGATVRWSDPDQDGSWNERTDYDAMGRESKSVPLK